MHPKVSGDARDRATALQRQPHAALDKLIGVLLRTCHADLASARARPRRQGLRQTRPGSKDTTTPSPPGTTPTAHSSAKSSPADREPKPTRPTSSHSSPRTSSGAASPAGTSYGPEPHDPPRPQQLQIARLSLTPRHLPQRQITKQRPAIAELISTARTKYRCRIAPHTDRVHTNPRREARADRRPTNQGSGTISAIEAVFRMTPPHRESIRTGLLELGTTRSHRTACRGPGRFRLTLIVPAVVRRQHDEATAFNRSRC